MVTNNFSSLAIRFMSANATLSNISTVQTNRLNHQNENQIIQSLSTIEHLDMKKTDSEVTKNTLENHDMSKQFTQNTEKVEQSKKIKTPISKLAISGIVLTLGLGSLLYFHAHQQMEKQKQTIAQLQSELIATKQSITDDVTNKMSKVFDQQNKQLNDLTQQINQQLKQQANAQQKLITQTDDAIKVTEQNITQLNERIAALSTADNNVWLISQANYLVNLAGRKIWNDQDYTTARLLLKNADTSLAQANDPSLLPARQAISQDISNLAAISFTDFDGLVIKLMSLADSVNQLPLAHYYQNEIMTANNNDDPVVVQNSTDTNISESISDWYQNLVNSSQSFFSKFIQIERYDSFNECIAIAGQDNTLLEQCQDHNAILMPEQGPYLRENIKLRLLIAAQAVPRHQEIIYQQALQDVVKWANVYFAKHSPAVQAFLADLNQLQLQTISNHDVPQQLASYNELNKLMQVRVRAMLTN